MSGAEAGQVRDDRARGIFILFLLALDLGVFHRKPHVVTPREALTMSAAWRPARLPAERMGAGR
jgi:hypothetical protein